VARVLEIDGLLIAAANNSDFGRYSFNKARLGGVCGSVVPGSKDFNVDAFVGHFPTKCYLKLSVLSARLLPDEVTRDEKLKAIAV
tara:strand:+ start:4780 stop:5034 length:255 start_codon:yes stop_codon:yes gene_type:complete